MNHWSWKKLYNFYAFPDQSTTVGVTTPAAPHCGENCNKTITITPSTATGLYQWESTNWGISDYPEDCICILNVNVSFEFFITCMYSGWRTGSRLG